MHIVHVGIEYATETLDGATRAVSGYARYQAELGHMVTMVQFVRSGGRTQHDVDDIRQVRLPVARWPRLGREAADFFRENALGGDVYHFHTSYIRMSEAARLLPAPYVVSSHGSYMPRHLGSRRLWNRVYQELGGRRHLESAVFVHAITEAEKRANERYAPRAKVVILPNCLDLRRTFDQDLRETTRERLGLADDDLLLVYLGRYDIEGKGLDTLLQAFERAHQGAPRRLVLKLFGNPAGDEARLRRIAPAHLSADVTISPPVLGEEKSAILSAADAFTILSRGDVMPTAGLDALGHGLSLLVTEETGFAEFLHCNDAGRIVSHDPAEAAAVMQELDPRLLLEGRQRRIESAQAVYSPKQIAARFISLYREALSPRADE
jgi:glycosyltransferase involved in cell wall biosynthesis